MAWHGMVWQEDCNLNSIGNGRLKKQKPSYLVRCISPGKLNEPHVMFLYRTFPISKVEGLIAATKHTMTVGIPGGMKRKNSQRW